MFGCFFFLHFFFANCLKNIFPKNIKRKMKKKKRETHQEYILILIYEDCRIDSSNKERPSTLQLSSELRQLQYIGPRSRRTTLATHGTVAFELA
jgi:hypothetical protein